MELILTLGVAGAGKSTLVNELLSSNKKLQVLCLDDIRLALGDIYDIRTEPVVRMIADVMGRTFMERKLPFIVDSTCTSIKIAEMWIRLAAEYGYKTHGIHLDTPFDVCCERRLDSIPLSVLEKQRDGLNDLLQFTKIIGGQNLGIFDKFEVVRFHPKRKLNPIAFPIYGDMPKNVVDCPTCGTICKE